MWPFKPKTALPLSPGLDARLDALEQGVAGLKGAHGSPVVDARLDALEKGIDALLESHRHREVEWSEWFDKFRRLYARIAKRVERDGALEPEEGPREAPRTTIGPHGTTYHPPRPRRNLRGF